MARAECTLRVIACTASLCLLNCGATLAGMSLRCLVMAIMPCCGSTGVSYFDPMAMRKLLALNGTLPSPQEILTGTLPYFVPSITGLLLFLVGVVVRIVLLG